MACAVRGADLPDPVHDRSPLYQLDRFSIMVTIAGYF